MAEVFRPLAQVKSEQKKRAGGRHTRKGSKAIVRNSKGHLLPKKQRAKEDARASEAGIVLARTHLKYLSKEVWGGCWNPSKTPIISQVYNDEAGLDQQGSEPDRGCGRAEDQHPTASVIEKVVIPN